MKALFRSLMFLAALAAAPALAAAELAGVKFEDKIKAGASELQLNGAGIRTRFMLKVYAIGLYLAERKSSADAVLAAPGAKRIHIVTLRDLGAQQFADALVEQINKNHGAAELAALKPAIDEFKATLLALNAAPSGTVIAIDYAAQDGTRLTVNGQPKGKAIAGEDFHRALLRIWLGDKPAQADLKDALLGKTG